MELATHTALCLFEHWVSLAEVVALKKKLYPQDKFIDDMENTCKEFHFQMYFLMENEDRLGKKYDKSKGAGEPWDMGKANILVEQ